VIALDRATNPKKGSPIMSIVLYLIAAAVLVCGCVLFIKRARS
jgi:hypothetical protein